MKGSIQLLTFVLAIAISSQAGAWGNEGHRVIARIAADHLTPEAAGHVASLLAGETDPTLPGIASWADDIRPQRRETAALHFVNFQGDCHYTARDCPGGRCAVAAIEHYEAVLADPSESAATRAEALKFTVHIIGDLHQPFHVSDRPDKGANTYQVQFEGHGTNLHHVWDTDLVEAIDRNWRDLAARLAPDAGTPIRFSEPAQFAPAAWAEEGCMKVDDQGLYPAGHSIGEDYVAQHTALVEHQLELAGERLAAVLNMALDP